MTAVCGGGPSGPLPGVPRNVAIEATAVDAAIAILGFPELAAALSPLVVAAPYNTELFCSVDPPADPGLTAQDVSDALDFTNPAVNPAAVQKVLDWWNHQYWYKICGCTTGTATGPGAPSNPGTGVGNNTGLPGPQNAPGCWTASTTITVPPNGVELGATNNITAQMMPAGAGPFTPSGYPVGVHLTYIDISDWNLAPAGAAAATYAMTVVGDTAIATSGNVYGAIVSSTDNSSPLTFVVQTCTPSGPTSATLNAPFVSNNGKLYMGVGGYNTDTIAHQVQISWTWKCTVDSRPNAFCCPPDPVATQNITRIIATQNNSTTLINTLQTDVTNITTDINVLQTDVTNNSTAINSNTTAINNQQTQITNNTTAINNNTTQITTLQTDVTNLSNTVNNVVVLDIQDLTTITNQTSTDVLNLTNTVNTLVQTINNLQAFVQPYKYVLGTAHAGLSGAGSFAVSFKTGVLISITTLPGYIGESAGTPTRLFDVGYVSVSTADGTIDETRVINMTQIWQPERFAEGTSVGYYLNPGVVVTITELSAHAGFS